MAAHQNQSLEDKENLPGRPQGEGDESSKSMKTRGACGKQIICDPAARKKKKRQGPGTEMMVSLSIYPPSFIGASFQSTLQEAAL